MSITDIRPSNVLGYVDYGDLEKAEDMSPTIQDSMKDGKFETVKELCQMDEYEIVFIKKDKMKAIQPPKQELQQQAMTSIYEMR